MTFLLVAVVCLMFAVGTVVYILVSGRTEHMSDVVLRQKLSSDDFITTSAVSLADSVISRARRDKKATDLSVAGLSLRPAEWLVLRVAFVLGLGAIGYAVFNGWMGIVGAVLGLLLPKLWLSFRIGQARKRFEEDLADVLQLASGSIRSGLSLSSALQVASTDGRQPTQGEIVRILSKARLDIPIEESMMETAIRMKSSDFEWVALAVSIQKEVGGNLADILEMTAETIRERAYLKRQVRTLSAEGRLSSYILMGLPIVVGGATALLNPEYSSLLWTTPIGIGMLSVTGVMMVIGWLFMRKIVRLEP